MFKMDNFLGRVIVCIVIFGLTVPTEALRCRSSKGTTIYCSTACCGSSEVRYCCRRQYKTAVSTSSSGLYYYTYYYKVYYTYYYYSYSSSSSSGGLTTGGIYGIIAGVLSVGAFCAACCKMCRKREDTGGVTFRNRKQNQQAAISTITT